MTDWIAMSSDNQDSKDRWGWLIEDLLRIDLLGVFLIPILLFVTIQAVTHRLAK